MTRLIIFPLLFLLGGSFAKALSGSDAFGHFWGDEDQLTLLDFEWIDISESGRRILLPDSGDKANLKLNPPLVLYGNSHPEVVVSRNGYISSDPTDPGGDETNDCPFPGAVSSGGGARIAALHDNLEIDPAGGGIYHQYFPVSPHSWAGCGVHVIQWENMRHVGSTETFDFQVLLFDHFDIVMQFGPGNTEQGSNSSTGIQNLAASLGNAAAVGLKIACDFSGGVSDNYALAILPPREKVDFLDDPAGLLQPGTLRHILATAKDGSRIEFNSSLDGMTLDLATGNGGSGTPLMIEDKVLCIDADYLLDEGITIRGLKDSETTEASSIRINDGSDVRFNAVDLEPHQNDPVDFTIAATGTSSDDLDNHLTICQAKIVPAEDLAVIVNSTNLQLNDVSISGNGIVMRSGNDFTPFHFGLGDSNISGSTVPAVESEGGYELNINGSSLSLNLSDVIVATGHTDVLVNDSNILLNFGRGIEADLTTGGFIRVEDSSISFNTAGETSQGGAIRSLGAGNITIERSTISGNQITHSGGAVNRGAGIYVGSEQFITIKDTTFEGNSCEEGAAIYTTSQEGTLRTTRIERCTFEDNDASLGGTLDLSSCDVSMMASTVTENEGSPVVRVSAESNVEICTNTFHANDAERLIGVDAGAEVEVRENIFSLGGGSFFIGGGMLEDMGSNLCDKAPTKLGSATNILDSDPLLGTYATHGGHTKCYMLLAGSPAIDAGNSVLPCTYNDQRNLLKTIDGDLDGTAGRDIGSVEYQGQVVVTTHLDEVADPGAGVSLREALMEVSPGGLVTFAQGLGGRVFTLDSTLILNEDVTIDASALVSPPIISGGESVQVFKLNGVQAAFENLNIVDGRTAGIAGAGIQVVGGAEGTFDNCSVRRCRAGASGGGIFVDGLSTLVMRDSEVSGNDITAAGGGKGGGIYGATGSRVQLVRVQISGNTTTSLGNGGGIAFDGGDPGALQMKRCSIVRNTCGENGAGLYLEDVESFILNNSTISGNASSFGNGGGIYTDGVTTGTITHSTIADNSCASGAGGVHLSSDSQVTASHTILAANRNTDGLRNAKLTARVTSNGYNLCDDNSIAVSMIPGDLLNRPAHLAPLANYGRDVLVHALLQISPAIDAGSVQAIGAPTLDQRGYGRIQDGDGNGAARIDIGAFEAGRTVVVTTEADETAANGMTSLREAIGMMADGRRITFDRDLSGLSIDLNAGRGSLNVAHNIQIDATNLPDGLTINGQDSIRCLRVTGERAVALNALEFKNGNIAGNGGIIQTGGDLVLNYCTLRSSHAGSGGGAVACSGGEMMAWNTSFLANTSDGPGSAIRLAGPARAKFEHCTLADNISGTGEGVIVVDGNRLNFYSTLLAGNGVLFFNEGAALVFDLIETKGYNLVDSTGAILLATFDAEGDIGTNDPVLGSIANTGGWGPIVQPLSAGPAKNAGDPNASLLSAFDVRGFLRVEGAAMDIGSVEFNGKLGDSDSDEMPDWWELLYGFDPNDSSDADDDPDSDNESNLAEYQAGTDPRKSDLVDPEPTETPLRIISVMRGAAPDQLIITFASDPGVAYRVLGSATLEDLNDASSAANIFGTPDGNVTTVPVQGLDPQKSFFMVKILDQ